MAPWFRVPVLDPHMTFQTLAAARAAMHAAGITGRVIRYTNTASGVTATTIR